MFWHTQPKGFQLQWIRDARLDVIKDCQDVVAEDVVVDFPANAWAWDKMDSLKEACVTRPCYKVLVDQAGVTSRSALFGAMKSLKKTSKNRTIFQGPGNSNMTPYEHVIYDQRLVYEEVGVSCHFCLKQGVRFLGTQYEICQILSFPPGKPIQ